MTMHEVAPGVAISDGPHKPWTCPRCSEPTGMRCGREGICGKCDAIATAAWQARMAIRMDASQFDPQKLINKLLNQHWMHECKIIPDYMPPFPNADTRPTCIIQYTYDDGDTTCLRYSRGPMQGYFWDIYGEDFHSPELALAALIQAPAPTRVHAIIPTHGT